MILRGPTLKEGVGLIAAMAWGLIVLTILGFGPVVSAGSAGEDVAAIFLTLSILLGWIMTAWWVGMDASQARAGAFRWAFLTLATGPVGLMLYLITRPLAPYACSKCFAIRTGTLDPCPSCGYRTYAGRAFTLFNRLCGGFADSFVRAPIDRAKQTTRQMTVALAAIILFGFIAQNAVPSLLRVFTSSVLVLLFASYWVLAAWWVYLDALWRRMDALPWAVLTLLSNVLGIVTYLVVRYPDPKSCPQCGSYLPLDLKRCPYCCAEAEPSCPKCQASVRSDWVYCPACAAQLPAVREDASAGDATKGSVLCSIRGTVMDAVTGSPIVGAKMMIDSTKLDVTTTSDHLGRFTLAALTPRPYVIVASAEGYVCEAKGSPPSEAGTAQVHFSLQAVPSHSAG